MRYIVGVLFAVSAFLLVMLCMPATGAIYTHDSISYEYAASTLQTSGELLYFGYDTPIIQWPPFYIALTAVIGFVGIPFAQGAAWINAICFAALIFVSAIYLFDALQAKWLAVPALILQTASVPLIYVSGYAWTETLFIFLAVLSMVLMVTYLKHERLSWLVWASIVSGICWMTRYIGITIIAVLAMVLFFSVKPFVEKIKKTFVYLIFSCFPMALWVIRNYMISATFTGGRLPGEYTLSDNLELSISVFQEWLSYVSWDFTYLAVGLFAALILIALFVKKQTELPFGTDCLDMVTNLFIVAVYSIMLFASATNAAMDPLNNRLWSPVFPFWIFVLVFLFDVLIQNIQSVHVKRWLLAGFTVFALVAVINPLFWINNEGFSRKDALLGTKEAPGVKESPTLKLAIETITPSEDTLVISNDTAVLTMHSDLKCYYPPKKNSIPFYSYSRYTKRIQNYQNIYLVWNGPIESESFMDVKDFGERYEMEKVAHNNYCIIYLLKNEK